MKLINNLVTILLTACLFGAWTLLILILSKMVEQSNLSTTIKSISLFLFIIGLINGLLLSIGIAHHITPKITNHLNPNNNEETKEN